MQHFFKRYFLKNLQHFRNHKEIDKDTLKQAKIFILAGPQNQFTEQEFKHLKVIPITHIILTIKVLIIFTGLLGQGWKNYSFAR